MDSRDTTAESASREPNLVKPVASFSPSFQQARPQAPAGYPRGPPSNGPVGGAPAARPAGQAQLRRLDSRTALTGPNQYPQVRLGPPRPPGGPFPQRGPYPQNVQGYPPRFPQQPQLQLQQQRPQQQQLPPRSGSQPGQFQRPARPQVEGPPLTRNESVLNLSKRGPQQLDDANRQQARQQVAAGRMMTDVGSVGGKLQQMDSPQRRKAADVRENGENDDDDDVVMDNRKPVKNGETVQRVESETKLGRLMGNEGKPTEAGQDDKTVARSGIDGSVKREEAKAGQGRPESGKIEDSVKSNSIGVDDKSGEVRVIEKVEKEIEEKVKSEKDKLEKELDKEKAEKERAEKENAEKEKAEKEKEKAEKEKEKAEKEKAEREKLEKEKAEKEKLEKEKAERERLEREEAEKEKLEREKAEKEKLEREKAEKEKLEREKAEKEKLEREKAEKEKLEREKAEKEKLEREKAEKERLEKERAERELQEKLDKEKAEKEQSEKDKAEQESTNKLDICKPEPKKDEPPKEVDKSKEEKPSSKAEDRQDSEPSQPAETVKDSSPEKVSEEESKKAQPPRMSVDLEKPSPPVLQQRKEDESPHDKSRASTPGEVRPETPAVSEDGLRVPRKPETRSSSPADADNNTTTDTTDASEPEKLVVDSLSLDVNEEVTVSIEECPNEGAQAEGARSPIGSVKGYDNGQRRSLRSSRSSLSTSPVSPKSPTTEASRLLPERKRATFNEETIGTGRKQQDEHQKPAKPGKVQRAPTPAKLNEKGPSAKSEIENGTGTNDPAQPNTLPTTNGVADSPTKKSPSKSRDGDKRSTAGSPVKSPSKSAKSLPRTPDTPSSTAGQEKKKLPMNKIQVGSAPSPNLKTVRSKIGSLENASYKPGGGKVKIENRKLDFSKAQPKIAAKNEKYTPSGGDKKIAQVKLQWNAKPKVGSLENATYKPGGGDKKIETVKLDFKDKAKPKVGSKDNAKHVPGGGSVKSSATPPKTPQDSSNDIQTQKLDIKAESKIGSLDNVKHKPGGGEKKIFNDRDYLRQTGSNVESLSGSGSQSPVPSGAITDGKNGLPASDENLNQGC